MMYGWDPLQQDELLDELRGWDPLQEDYSDSQFNQYISGPGAYIDSTLPPFPTANRGGGGGGRNLQNKNGDNKNNNKPPHNNGNMKPYLVLKNVPQGMTKSAIHNLCSSHGRVAYVRDSNKNDYIFVDLPSVGDMEAVYRGLENNNYGIQVLVGKQFQNILKNNPNNSNKGISMNAKVPLPPVQLRRPIVDLESRTCRPSGKHPLRPQFSRNPVVSNSSYDSENSLLKRHDPQRKFVWSSNDDAHNVERAGLSNGHTNNNSKYKYQTGRAYVSMPEKTKKFIENKHQQSAGNFNPAKGSYQNETPKDTKKPLAVGKCIVCKRDCDIVCARCYTYICGLECQRKSWPEHRYICGKPKNSLNSSSSNGEGGTTQLPSSSPTTTSNTASLNSSNPPQPENEIQMPRSGNLVTLSAVSKANVVFIRSKTYEENVIFFKTINDIQAMAKDLNKLQKPPNCGQIVITKFQGQYNRAMILNADDLNCIKLVYIDYGNLDRKPLSDIYETPQKFVDMPRLAIPVILKDVPECYVTTEVRNFMYSYLDGIDLVVKYKEKEDFLPAKGVYQVELIDETTHQNFNKTIVALSKPVEPKCTEEIYYRNHLKQEVLPTGDNIELVLMDNSLLNTGCISCTTKEYALEIQDFQMELQKYGDSLEKQNYAPRVNELCIAKYSVDEKWYRGYCLELVGDGNPSIVFIDYGNIAFVNVKDIRRYPPQFSYPIYTVNCEIHGLPEECEANLVNKLEELIPNGSTINCDNLEVCKEDNFYVITMDKIIQKLKEEGFLKSPADDSK